MCREGLSYVLHWQVSEPQVLHKTNIILLALLEGQTIVPALGFWDGGRGGGDDPLATREQHVGVELVFPGKGDLGWWVNITVCEISH